MGIHPIHDTLMIDTKMTTNPTIIHTVYIHLNRLQTQICWITNFVGVGCIFALALLAFDTLTA